MSDQKFLINNEIDGWDVVLNGEYPRTSVLAGEDFWRTIGFYNSQADALSEHPDAEILDHDPRSIIAWARRPLPDTLDDREGRDEYYDRED